MSILVFVFLAVVFFVIGFLIYRDIRTFKMNGIHVKGIVFENNIGKRGIATAKARSSFPVIQFLTLENEQIIGKSSIGISSGYKKGKEVAVIYLKDSPQKFIIDDKVTNFFPYLMWLVGIIIIVAGIVQFIYAK